MSYILDALKKADAERTRGLIPSIYAQPTRLNAHKSDRPWVTGSFIMILIGMGVTLLCLIVWWWINIGISWRALIATPIPQPVIAKTYSPPQMASTTATVAPPFEKTTEAKKIEILNPTTQDKRFTPKTLAPEVMPRQHPMAGVNKIPSVHELSEDIRLSLPKIVVSGATYAVNPAYRMLIINGQIFYEGDKPLSNLKLEKIKPNEAVLNYKGTRYFQAY